MNKHFFRGVLVITAISTTHFAVQAIFQFSQWISYSISIGTLLSVGILTVILWRKHHPWVGGMITGFLVLHVVPIVYLMLMALLGKSIM